ASADESGIERARRRIESADRADMREGVEYIRASCGEVASPGAVDDEAPDPEPVSDDRLRAEARALFERVVEAGIETPDSHHWATVKPWTAGNGEPLALLPADDSLYFGRCGIALLGAGLHRVTDESTYREFALDAVRPVREALSAGRDASALDHLGGATGVGSVAYGLAAVGDLLEEPSAIEDATRVGEVLSGDRIAADHDYDVVGGAAGTILGLLAVNDRRASPELVDVAVACGEHLLDASLDRPDGIAWETFDGTEPLTGFAHGAAGIAYALARLSDATGRDDFRDAALDAIRYEASTYDPGACNWPDYRTDERHDEFTDQWCHGRSGIGLARIGTAEYVDGDLVTRGVDRAASAFDDELVMLDHLCCGNAGRATFLLEAERRYDRRVGRARAHLGATLARKEATGSYQLHSYTEQITDPTLFMGLSGIGYAMLRTTAPEDLPAVLLWE
ncbi:type 2 lantipeptide synthetase LanM, partial [Halobacteriales archaeon QS_1_68_20]